MGYYTNFKLEFEVVDSTGFPDTGALEEKISALLDKVTGYQWDGGLELADAKWYNHDEDMTKISKSLPKILFTLEGDGEEHGDQWVTYYQNGKKQHVRAVVTFPPFDPIKLQ